ncbi:MAG: hypothetical protein GXO80_11785 [Chlorobi bacterium]|nr:hypothetical protein [Chlorobiota bacterium]
MEINKIIEYIEEPYNMQNKDLENLKSLTEKYPFFNTVNLLYVKASNNIKAENYNSLIAKVSASVPNRELLFELINITAPVKKETDKIKVKKEESATRKEIRERIKQRRQKRMVQKGGTFYEHGLSVHKKIVKLFFKPVIEELVTNENNIGLMPDKIKEFYTEKNIETQKSSESKDAEREKKRIEREKRIAAKLKKRLEEQENLNPEALEREKAEREQRRLEREKRMKERRRKAEEENIQSAEKPEENTDDAENKRAEREKRAEERQKRREKEKQENNNTLTDNTSADKEQKRIEREKRLEEKLRRREQEKLKKEEIEISSEKDETEISVEEDPFTNIIDIESIKKVKIKNTTPKAETEKLEKTDKKDEEEVSDDLIIIIEETTNEIAEDNLKEQESEIEAVVEDADTDEGADNFADKKSTETIKSKKKSKLQKTIVEDLKVSQINNENEIADIYDKIISSKKPVTKTKKNNFIEIKEDIIGIDDTNKEESETGITEKDIENVSEENKKTEILTEQEEKIISKNETVTVDNEKTENLSLKEEDIEFEIEDTREHSEQNSELKETETINENSSDESNNQSDEVFELIDNETYEKEDVSEKEKEESVKITDTEDIKKEDKAEEQIKPEVTENLEIEKAEAKAAESVFARIEAFKKKRAGLSENNDDKNEKSEENKNNLIEKFVQEEPGIKRPSPTDKIDETIENAEKESVENKPVVTELMASIFINQGKYNDAIDIYEKLILKNPEKKDYFAVKIDETKKLKN